MVYKILIIDDHPETRGIIGQVLKHKGYHIVTAENGQEGVEVAERELPHIILCDYMMPVMDGVEAVRKLRKNDAFDKVPIIMFTAVDDPRQKLAAFDAGADDYLNKPTEPPELVDRVQILLQSAYGEMPKVEETATKVVSKPKVASYFLSASESESELPSNEQPKPQAQAEAGFLLPASRQIIAVMGVRGGVGTTTTAINIASVLSGAGTATTLVDFDAKKGHIGLYLNQKTPGALNALASMSNGEIASQLQAYVAPYAHNLKLLLAHLNVDAQYPIISGTQAAAILMALAVSSKATVVDLGNTFSDVSRSTLELASQVVVCLRPERIALVAARQLLSQLQKILFVSTNVHVVLVDFSGGNSTLPKTAVENFLGHSVEAVVPILPREMAQTTNKAEPIVSLFAQSEAGIAYRQFAHLLKKV
ncbi:MAG: hypothetical protein CSA11_07540 [Chloroflexi bacterium]|nr:MAG: hypothetical protein CSA11_07540 [Chloroflexota bacterium]